MSVSVTALIHDDAHVGLDVTIGDRTRVWQFASVIRKAEIGADCSVASCAIVDGARVGNATIISHGAFIDPGIIIGAECFIGPHVSLCNDIWPRASKLGWFDIKDLIDGRIAVTVIDDGASIGANAVVLPGVRIGAGAMVAAGIVCTRDVPPHTLLTKDGLSPIENESRINRRRACSM